MRSPPNSTSPKPPGPCCRPATTPSCSSPGCTCPPCAPSPTPKQPGPAPWIAVTIQIDDDDTARLLQQWSAHEIGIPLIVLDSPFREITRPFLDYLRGVRRHSPRDVITVFIPEYVVGRWWEQLLHNQSALRLKTRLLFEPGVMVTSVPWQLRSTRHLDQPTPITTTRRPPAPTKPGNRAPPKPNPDESRRDSGPVSASDARRCVARSVVSANQTPRAAGRPGSGRPGRTLRA